MSHNILDKRWCDLDEDYTSTQTVREWIHDACKCIYKDANYIPDEELNKMPSWKIKDIVDDYDYLLGK